MTGGIIELRCRTEGSRAMRFLEKLSETMAQAALSELGIDIRDGEIVSSTVILERSTALPKRSPAPLSGLKAS
jgi:hypothetical protein